MRKKTNTKKNRNVVEDDEYYSKAKVPHSIVINHGPSGTNIKNLISDFRKVMKPNTAEKLVAKKSNTLGDFVKMAGPMGVTHLILFSQTKQDLYLKLSRLPQGPTLTFSIKNYSLLKDVISGQAQQMIDEKNSMYAPCLMTNIQPSEGEKHLQLCSKMFLDMFPTISPSHVQTSNIRRCCLIHYNETEENFDFRHYAIKIRPLGISKATRKLISNKIPNLSSYTDVAEFVVKSEVHSDSEAEEDATNQVNVKRKYRGNVVNQQSIIKLAEIGPRLTLELVKIEKELCKGTVLYHKYIMKTDEQKLESRKKRENKRELKKKRTEQQNQNIKQKEEKKEGHRQRCLKGMGIDASSKRKREEEDDEEEDDDYAYYKEEVGEEPEKDLFQKKIRRDKSEFKKKYVKKSKK